MFKPWEALGSPGGDGKERASSVLQAAFRGLDALHLNSPWATLLVPVPRRFSFRFVFLPLLDDSNFRASQYRADEGRCFE